MIPLKCADETHALLASAGEPRRDPLERVPELAGRALASEGPGEVRAGLDDALHVDVPQRQVARGEFELDRLLLAGLEADALEALQDVALNDEAAGPLETFML